MDLTYLGRGARACLAALLTGSFLLIPGSLAELDWRRSPLPTAASYPVIGAFCAQRMPSSFFPLPNPAWYNLLVALQAAPSAQPATATVVTQCAIGEVIGLGFVGVRPHCCFAFQRCFAGTIARYFGPRCCALSLRKARFKPGFPCAFCICLGLSAVGLAPLDSFARPGCELHDQLRPESHANDNHSHAADGMGGRCDSWTSKHSNQQFGQVSKIRHKLDSIRPHRQRPGIGEGSQTPNTDLPKRCDSGETPDRVAS
ncbi:hypothetical protein CDEST_08374 [Colletotrichum destructivum]|uniref:Uncharacterized protein n=1 Tax=Colletotrichum destructivum TaxID=34406 RepID=A0AAX4IJ43_9PEZI|nr:hypothetical protein CDEST_08374 [Colletotrichum destructivum]